MKTLQTRALTSTILVTQILTNIGSNQNNIAQLYELEALIKRKNEQEISKMTDEQSQVDDESYDSNNQANGATTSKDK